MDRNCASLGAFQDTEISIFWQGNQSSTPQDPIFIARHARRTDVPWVLDYLRRSCGWSSRRRRGRARGRRRATAATALRPAGRRRRCWWCHRPRPGSLRPPPQPPPASHRSRSRPSRSLLRLSLASRVGRGRTESNCGEEIFLPPSINESLGLWF
jgi:hypothetical protein